MKDLPSRFLGALLVVVPTLIFVYFGRPFLAYYLVVLVGGAILEWYLNLQKEESLLPVGLLGGLGIFVSVWLLGVKGSLIGISFFLIFSLLVSLFGELEPSQVALSFLGVTYVALGFSHFFLLREAAHGLILIVFLLLTVWIFDVFSYFVGTLWGYHLLMPSVSPRKTWEGLFGGVLGAVLVGLLFHLLGFFNIFFSLSAALFLSLFAILGDLFESRMKRYFGVKDSGQIYLAHGGVLDRFDAILLASLAFYYFVRCF